MEKCQKKALILYKGYPSLWDGVDWLSLSFESVIDLAGFSAKFRLGNFTFENSNLFEDWIINLTAEETGTLPLGMNTASLIVYDALGEGKPFTTSIPILVKDWVQGDVEIDTYKAVVKATLDNQTQIAIRIETAKVSLDWVEGKIAEHNNSTDAHSYIQGLISSEKEARENADSSLSQRITENTNRFLNYRTRVQQDVIDNNLQEQINAVSGDLSNYRTAADQDIIDNAQNTAINGKQAKLNTAQMNAVNSGITSAKVSSYDSHIANTTIHVTAQDKQTWNAKQNALNSTQMDAVNSGITSAGVTQITTNKNNIADEITNRENADGELQDQINNLKARGRFLALWNCATGLAESNPPSGTYTYQSGDYFIIGVVAQAGQNNYKPDGSTYTTGVASTVIETQQVDTDDVYYYDGHVWRLQVNTQKEIGFVNIAGSPYDNSNLASALNTKISGVKVNGTELTPDSNHKVDVSVPTESTVSGWGFTKNIGTVTSVNNVSPVNGNVSISIPTSNDYWTVGTYGSYYSLQVTYSPKRIEYMPNEDGQDYGLAVMSANPTFEYVPYAGTWNGRMLVGNVDRSFLLGTATSNGSTTADMCCIGAHTWSPLGWDDIYLNTDGNKTVYIGGNNWTKSSGWFKVENSGSNSGGKVQVNTGTITDAVWKDVGTVKSVNNASPDSSGNVTITIPDPLPSQTGQSGKYLTTNGTTASWGAVNAGIFYWGE